MAAAARAVSAVHPTAASVVAVATARSCSRTSRATRARDAPIPDGTIVIERGVSAQEFGPKLNRTAADIVKFLLQHGEMVTATMALSDEHMELFALELGADLLLVDPGQEQEVELQALFDDSDDDDEELLRAAPAGDHRDGPRRPRQDDRARQDPLGQRGLR